MCDYAYDDRVFETLNTAELAAVLSIFTSVSVKDEDSIVKVEHVEAPEDWKVVDEEVIEPDDTPKGKVVDRILMKGPSKNRVLFTDGTEGFVEKTDDIIRYL